MFGVLNTPETRMDSGVCFRTFYKMYHFVESGCENGFFAAHGRRTSFAFACFLPEFSRCQNGVNFFNPRGRKARYRPGPFERFRVKSLRAEAFKEGFIGHEFCAKMMERRKGRTSGEGRSKFGFPFVFHASILH